MATHSSILAWEICMDRGAWRATVHRVIQSGASLKGHLFSIFLSYNNYHCIKPLSETEICTYIKSVYFTVVLFNSREYNINTIHRK